jgi:hypothetical protein
MHVLQDNFYTSCKNLFIACNFGLWRFIFASLAFKGGESLAFLHIKAKKKIFAKKKAGKTPLFLFFFFER